MTTPTMFSKLSIDNSYLRAELERQEAAFIAAAREFVPWAIHEIMHLTEQDRHRILAQDEQQHDIDKLRTELERQAAEIERLKLESLKRLGVVDEGPINADRYWDKINRLRTELEHQEAAYTELVKECLSLKEKLAARS